MRRELASTVTDSLRVLLMKACGYTVRVGEFVSSEHTPKNTLITATRQRPTESGRVVRSARSARATRPLADGDPVLTIPLALCISRDLVHAPADDEAGAGAGEAGAMGGGGDGGAAALAADAAAARVELARLERDEDLIALFVLRERRVLRVGAAEVLPQERRRDLGGRRARADERAAQRSRHRADGQRLGEQDRAHARAVGARVRGGVEHDRVARRDPRAAAALGAQHGQRAQPLVQRVVPAGGAKRKAERRGGLSALCCHRHDAAASASASYAMSHGLAGRRVGQSA